MSHTPYTFIYGFHTQTCTCAMYPLLPRKLLHDFISLWIRPSENFSPTFYFTRRIINWCCIRKWGNSGITPCRNLQVTPATHRRELERVLQLHSRILVASISYTAMDTSIRRSSHLKSKRINGNDATHKFHATTAY